MNKKPAPPITLESVLQSFAAWRRTRPSKRSRIPRHLLEQAAEVCRWERPTKVARQLGLSYAVLKKQIESSGPGPVAFREVKQEFVEVNLEGAFPASLVVEILRAENETIRFSFPATGPAQIREIVKLFL